MSLLAFPGQQRLSNGALFPAVFNCCADDDVDDDKQQVLLRNVDDWLAESGAVLVRGLPGLKTAADFDRFVDQLGGAEFPYAVGGEATRIRVAGRVFTANDGIPLDMPIGFHNEVAYLKDSPSRIVFFCEMAPAPGSGGCTLIAHGRTVYERMVQAGQQAFLDELEDKGVRYSKWLSSGHGAGSWKSMFKTEDQQEASQRYSMLNLHQDLDECLLCRAQKIGAILSWRPDGSAVFQSAPCPAIKVDQRSGQKLWFNTIHGIQVFKRTSADGAFDAVFGDCTPFSDSSIHACLNVLEDVKLAFPWQQGDVLIVDNQRVLHARQPCSQPRTILVSLMK